MTSFGWKRKRVLETEPAASWFSSSGASGANDFDEEGEDDTEGDIDWLSAAKRRRLLLLEDNATKSRRLREEGALLAENERYWEAIKYWDEAIQLTPHEAALYEMKSQVHNMLIYRKFDEVCALLLDEYICCSDELPI